jgi:hypothetical protein
MNRVWIWWFGVLALTVAPVTPQALGQESRVITLQNADSLVGKVIGGEDARELIGNVVILQENVVIRCDHAIEFRQSGRLELAGNVVVQDDSVTIRAPRGIYHRDVRRAEAFEAVELEDRHSRLRAEYGMYDVGPARAFFRSNVIVQDSGSTLICDSLIYVRRERRSTGMGRVVVRNAADQVTISGGWFEHDGALGFSRMEQNPILVQVDSSAQPPDTLVVRSRIMESYRDSLRRVVAIDSVEIARRDLAGRAGTVEFFTDTDSIRMRRTPVLWYDRTQVTGDSIDIFLVERALQRIEVMGAAMAISQDDTLRPDRFNQLAGDFMTLRFEERRLNRITVEHRAISLYFVYEDSLPNGLNRTSGDRVVIRMDSSGVDAISVHGGVEGLYYPENLVARRERTFDLPGFRWRTDRPALRSADVLPLRRLYPFSDRHSERYHP